jgi:hypothetical protein
MAYETGIGEYAFPVLTNVVLDQLYSTSDASAALISPQARCEWHWNARGWKSRRWSTD